MNLLILEEQQFIDEHTALASPRQAEHIQSVLRFRSGDTIKLGKLDGLIGSALVDIDGDKVFLRNVELSSTPPPKLPLTLLLAMPRPQMLKRILQTIATMGVEKICFIQTNRVEKSFWQSPSATDDGIRQQLILGLEQGMATQLPIVKKYHRFRPFVEDELPTICNKTTNIIADPAATQAPNEHSIDQAITLAIGPEGGFLKQEVQRFKDLGFADVHLGSRILKVETAVPVLLSKLYHFPKS